MSAPKVPDSAISGGSRIEQATVRYKKVEE